MQLYCYNFKKKNDSTARPSGAYVSFGFTFKNPTSLLNPVILLDTDISIYGYNYFYIPELDTYYFRNGIRTITNSIFELSLSIDTLATKKDDILNYTAFVERCASATHYNTNIPDNALSVTDSIVSTSSASTSCHISSSLMYIVRIIGRESTGGVGTFVLNQSAFSTVFAQVWGDIDTGSITGDLKEYMQFYFANPAQYIVGVYTTPIGASVYGGNVTSSLVYVGAHETDLSLDRITNRSAIVSSGLTLSKPSSIYSDFRKSDGSFSQYYIYLPTIGNLPLASDLIDTNLTIDIGADLITGDLLFTLKSDGATVGSYQSNCYSSVSIGSVNESSSVLSGATQTTLSLISANPFGVVEGTRTAFSQNPSVIGTQGGTGCVALANEIVISCVQRGSGEFPTDVDGKPCCKNLQLSSLSGYVKCSGASLNINADDFVISDINAKLNSGFYIE